MKRIHITETIRRVLAVLLLMCIIAPGIVWSAEIEAVTPGPVFFDFALMLPGQSKSYNVEIEQFPAILMVPVVIYGTGNIYISVSKNDTKGELFGVMQVGGYNPLVVQTKYGAITGVTPRNISLSARFYDMGYILVMSGLLVSTEDGPHRYSVSISIN